MPQKPVFSLIQSRQNSPCNDYSIGESSKGTKKTKKQPRQATQKQHNFELLAQKKNELQKITEASSEIINLDIVNERKLEIVKQKKQEEEISKEKLRDLVA
jgi:hypothetical protein